VQAQVNKKTVEPASDLAAMKDAGRRAGIQIKGHHGRPFDGGGSMEKGVQFKSARLAAQTRAGRLFIMQ
jgi:hypothetical protein